MIGIFDSGSGGLTVLRAIREKIPSADIVYFGDIKNVPYGDKTNAELARLAFTGFKLLQDRGATSIVSACNSVSVSLAVSLFDSLSIAPTRLIEMVGPTVSFFKGSDARILLCATPATVRSQIYESGFAMIDKHIDSVAIPDLAGAIEWGHDPAEIESTIRAALKDVKFSDYDVLILACTHYPLVIDIFRKVAGDAVVIFDPAYAVAERVEKWLWPLEAGDGKTRFLVSKDSPQFHSFIERMFSDAPSKIEVVE
jgi:glutamate racemase